MKIGLLVAFVDNKTAKIPELVRLYWVINAFGAITTSIHLFYRQTWLYFMA
jgi:hypothetical protein